MTKKICLISSHGGHFKELYNAVGNFLNEFPDYYWVTYKTKNTQFQLQTTRHYFIIDPVTSKIKFLYNSLQSFFILLKERPKFIISTGAGMAFFTLLLGKFLFGAKIIYIESASNVAIPSKTGRMVYKFSDLFLIQWENLFQFYPNAKYVGIL